LTRCARAHLIAAMRPLLAIPLLLTGCAAAPAVPVVEMSSQAKAEEKATPPAPDPASPSLPPSSCLRHATRFHSGRWMADEFATDAAGRLVIYVTAHGGPEADKRSVERHTLSWSRSGCLEHVVSVTEGPVHIEEEVVYRCGAHGEVLSAEHKSSLVGTSSYTYDWQGTFGPPRLGHVVLPTDFRAPHPSVLPLNLGARWYDARSAPFSFHGRVLIHESARNHQYEGFTEYDADGLRVASLLPMLKDEQRVRYDEAHRVIAFETPTKQEATRLIWAGGRVVASAWERPDKPTSRVDYRYDAGGRLLGGTSSGTDNAHEIRFDEPCALVPAR
jgi:hypothetical protein